MFLVLYVLSKYFFYFDFPLKVPYSVVRILLKEEHFPDITIPLNLPQITADYREYCYGHFQGCCLLSVVMSPAARVRSLYLKTKQEIKQRQISSPHALFGVGSNQINKSNQIKSKSTQLLPNVLTTTYTTFHKVPQAQNC